MSAVRPEVWPALPEVPARTVTCIGVPLGADADACCRLMMPWVSEAERRRAARYFHPIDAARHLVGRAVARAVLGRALGAEWDAGEFALGVMGKPGLPGYGIDFSISHAGRWVWAAFCRDAPVGIDVEELRLLDDLGDLVGVLHPAEAASIRLQAGEDARAAAFFRCWTRKEAVLKAVGEGLMRGPDSIQVRTDAVARDWLMESWCGQRDEWTTLDLAVPGAPFCQVAVAARAPGLQLATLVLEELGG